MICVDCKLEVALPSKFLKRYELQNYGKVQKYVDSTSIWRCVRLVPKDTLALYRSANINTKIGSGRVIWRTPYARRWYYRPAKFNGAPERGNYWFERMKNNGGRERILRDVKRMIRNMNKGVGNVK